MLLQQSTPTAACNALVTTAELQPSSRRGVYRFEHLRAPRLFDLFVARVVRAA